MEEAYSVKTICRFIIAAGLILLAVAVPAEAVGKIPAISAYQEQCMALEMKGNYGEAEKLYTQALVDYPTYTHFMVRRGEAYLHLGETQKAANDFTRALALDDKCGMAVLGQATMYALAGDMRQAREKFAAAHAMLGESPDFYLRRGKYYYEGMADFPHAFADLDKAIAAAPDEYKPSFYLAKFLTACNYANCYDNSYADVVVKDGSWLLQQEKMPDEVKAVVHYQLADLYKNVYKEYREGFRETEKELALAGDDAALQAGIFQLQYELLHYLDMPRAEKQAKDAVLYRTGKLGRAGEYH